jgi:protein involved in polysaccharide export with SLBB domain
MINATSFVKMIIRFSMAASLGGCVGISARDISELPQGITFNKDGEYFLGDLDQVRVTIVGDEKLSGPYSITTQGTIMLSFAGNIKMRGLTNTQAAQAIEKSLTPFVKHPIVTVTVLSRSSYKVFFSGQFTRIGPLQFEQPTTLMDAISMAGGLTTYANGRIILTRKTADGTRRYAVDYDDILAGKADLVVLDRGDHLIAE